MNYWEECINQAFDDAKIQATNEQITEVVERVVGAHETHDLVMGYECIPNPMTSEVERLKQEVSVANERAERITADFKKNVAMRRNVRPKDVVLRQNGQVEILEM